MSLETVPVEKMSFEEMVRLVGGPANIQRVLAPRGEIVIALRDPALVNVLPSHMRLREVLGEWQLSFLIQQDSINEYADELINSLGRMIDSQLRLNAYAYSSPNDCPFRPTWHISPPQGLLNDPNGFIYHQGKYHLFYQWYPYGCEHKDKYWVQLTSTDLIHWQWQGIALTPSDWYDSHGVFSGHALSHNDELMLFYTGNVRLGDQRLRQTTQCLAVSQDGLRFEKRGPVIRNLPTGVTEHIRDPKIVRHRGKWLMLLGAQTTQLQGRLAIYHSHDLKEWHFDGLFGEEIAPLGYMWECPDMFEIAGQSYFVFGPQGIISDNVNHTVVHQNRIAKVLWDENDHPHFCHLQPLDHGFDFYAPQTMQTADGRRVLCAWMGLPDEINHPSCDNGWLHQLTALRELSLENGQIIQRPIRELEQLCHHPLSLELSDKCTILNTKSFEMCITLPWGASLRLFEKDEQYVELSLDAQQKVLRFDRSHTLIRQGDVIRELALECEQVELQILADNSSLEVFINGGKAVMSARVFTEQEATGVSLLNALVTAKYSSIQPVSASSFATQF
ncbi:sucrose-6-phosphate hydrolase [Vibrio sp. V19_P1S1T109]|uniref:glycoside hydrolase family 32 protein n=1 Tax=Vibrio sp. V19_P1S1T109 TaxID=1938672 RepID=UPI000B8E4361|nr:glycoside hydrolase family 32 protein [Vibrio sp. V19_P1S1T109]OXX75165.1 sucrose-6-phosphate hydrolase [Vibrio sp. V19_P1S1T109]